MVLRPKLFLRTKNGRDKSLYTELLTCAGHFNVMPKEQNMTDFLRTLLSELESAFRPEELETLVRREARTETGVPTGGSAVKVVHKPTGHSIVCDEYETQIENKAMALVRLIALLKREPA
jgi:protein subunit release factor A